MKHQKYITLFAVIALLICGSAVFYMLRQSAAHEQQAIERYERYHCEAQVEEIYRIVNQLISKDDTKEVVDLVPSVQKKLTSDPLFQKCSGEIDVSLDSLGWRTKKPGIAVVMRYLLPNGREALLEFDYSGHWIDGPINKDPQTQYWHWRLKR